MELTPFHPILRGSVPQFPVDCADAKCIPSFDGYVYDFVLRNRSVVASPLQRVRSFVRLSARQVQESCMLVATFGHKETDGCFAHAYFGSEAVVCDLKTHSDWQAGYVLLDDYAYVRSENADRRVIGMVFTSAGKSSACEEDSFLYETKNEIIAV